jgi:AcrR family transcriptional regulator
MPKISPAQREARQQQILDAALTCFSKNGFHQTGMADIVRQSGLSHGAVYLYFQSKDDLIEALAVDRHRQEAMRNAAAQHGGDPIGALRALVRAYAAALIDPGGEKMRRVGVNGWAEALRNPRVRKGVIEGIEIPRTIVAGLIERSQRDGQLARNLSADAIARTLVATFQGFVLQAVWNQPLDVEACVAVIDRMLNGLLTSEAPPKRRKRGS